MTWSDDIPSAPARSHSSTTEAPGPIDARTAPGASSSHSTPVLASARQTASGPGVWYSVLTGICVGVGTLFFFLLFQKGGPLSAVPMILAGGAALMAIFGIAAFKERASWQMLLGIVMSIGGLFLLRYAPGK